jgi:hypothetical protein
VNVGDEVLLLLLKRVRDGHITEFCGFYFDEASGFPGAWLDAHSRIWPRWGGLS